MDSAGYIFSVLSLIQPTPICIYFRFTSLRSTFSSPNLLPHCLTQLLFTTTFLHHLLSTIYCHHLPLPLDFSLPHTPSMPASLEHCRQLHFLHLPNPYSITHHLSCSLQKSQSKIVKTDNMKSYLISVL